MDFTFYVDSSVAIVAMILLFLGIFVAVFAFRG
jgi:hypothetical protein